MHLQKTLIKIAAYVAIISISVSALAVSIPTQVNAQTESTLYGTGSADEINILKLLDMALNKGGMSMSPATIKAFLEFWWNSVKSDLNTCISNADTSITTTTAFVEYLYAGLEDSAHYDKLGDIIKRYIQFVLTMDYKSLSDFKQLLTQPETFRKFLLSYVTDEDGNIAGTVNNKVKRYNLKNGFVNMTRKAADAYIEEYEGYYLVPTFTYKNLTVSLFTQKEKYDFFYNAFQSLSNDDVLLFDINLNYVHDLSDIVLIGTKVDSSFNGTIVSYFSQARTYNENWVAIRHKYKYFSSFDSIPDLSDESIYNMTSQSYYVSVYSSLLSEFTSCLFTKDGRTVKIWKSLDSYKAYSVGKSNIYYSKDYASFDDAKDNGVTFSGAYYNGDYSHDTIQNNIDNSQTIDESTINNIVNNYITNNYYGDSSGSGSGSGSGSSGWWDIGTGVDSFIQGVASLLDFILKLLGDLIGLLGNFLTSTLQILTSLSALGQGFGEFISASFQFLPEECITLIVSSIGVMCLVGVIKVIKG